MRKAAVLASVALLALSVASCGKQEVTYDPTALGFSNKDEMNAAFAKGYHSKQKLLEMTAQTQSSPPPVTSAQPATERVSPSFDCAKAGSSQEKLVCADNDLAKLDMELHQAYLKARDASETKDVVLAEQRAWIKNRFNVCADKACLTAAYGSRIDELNL